MKKTKKKISYVQTYWQDGYEAGRAAEQRRKERWTDAY